MSKLTHPLNEVVVKSISSACITNIELYHDMLETIQVTLKSVTDEEIQSQFQLPPSAFTAKILVTGERAKWYMEHLGEYVTITITKGMG